MIFLHLNDLWIQTSLKKAMCKFGSQKVMRACNWKHTCFFFFYLALVFNVVTGSGEEFIIRVEICCNHIVEDLDL